MLSLPIAPEGSNKEACLETFKNKLVYVNSFTVSQQDMLDSVLRVTGDKREDWTIEEQPAAERYEKGVRAFKEGDRKALSLVMYSRVFYADGNGDFESRRGTLNRLLGLPRESIDEATKVAIARAKASQQGYKYD